VAASITTAASDWTMGGGTWDDSANWDDSGTWNDGV